MSTTFDPDKFFNLIYNYFSLPSSVWILYVDAHTATQLRRVARNIYNSFVLMTWSSRNRSQLFVQNPFFYSHWSSLTRMDAYFMSIGGVAPIKSPFRSGCVGSLSISFFLYFCVSINIISGWRCCTEHKQWLEGKKNISSWWKKKKTKQNIDEAIQLEILIFINFPSNLVFWSPLCPPPNCYYAGQKLNCDFNQCNSGGWWQPSMSTVDFRAWIRVERRGGQHVAFSLSLC